jgi:hypothetical protein
MKAPALSGAKRRNLDLEVKDLGDSLSSRRGGAPRNGTLSGFLSTLPVPRRQAVRRALIGSASATSLVFLGPHGLRASRATFLLWNRRLLLSG